MKTSLEALETCILASTWYPALQRGEGRKPGQAVLMFSKRFPQLKDLKSSDLVNLAPWYVRKWTG